MKHCRAQFRLIFSERVCNKVFFCTSVTGGSFLGAGPMQWYLVTLTMGSLEVMVCASCGPALQHLPISVVWIIPSLLMSGFRSWHHRMQSWVGVSAGSSFALEAAGSMPLAPWQMKPYLRAVLYTLKLIVFIGYLIYICAARKVFSQLLNIFEKHN